MKKRYNLKLIVGSILFGFFLFIAFFGSYLAPYEKEDAQPVIYMHTEEGSVVQSAPYPPSKKYLFGTDKWGYDLLSLLLQGAKYTVFTCMIVAFLRVLIGGFWGIYQGLRGKEIRTRAKINLLSGLPNFLIIYFIIVGINIEPTLSSLTLIMIQGIFMVIIGVAGVQQTVQAKTIEINKNLFVTASESHGATKLHILRKHIFPILKGNLFLIYVNEMVLVLNLIGQLAIFNLFLGGTERTFNPVLYHSMTNEWAGMIAQWRLTVYSTQWVVFFPLLVYLIFLFTFYLLSSGLKDMQRNKMRQYLMM